MDSLYNKTSLILSMEGLLSDNGASVLFGSASIQDLKVGNSPVIKAYIGNNLIFPISDANGLIGTRYIGYHNENPEWFLSATTYNNRSTKFTSINGFSSSPDSASEDYYSWEWVGYFKALTSEVYTFYLNSDDGSYLWLGSNAVSGYTTSNALVNNGGAHAPQETYGSIALIADTYYPIRIQFGEIGGGDVVTVSFSTDTISKTTDGNGYYYNRI